MVAIDSHICMGFQDSESGLLNARQLPDSSPAQRAPSYRHDDSSGSVENGSSPEFAHRVKKAINASVGIKGTLTMSRSNPGRAQARHPRSCGTG